jgi:D-alanine-D-alanine ligase
MAAIDQSKYTVVPIGITKEGRWLAGGDVMEALEEGAPATSQPVALLADPSRRGLYQVSDRGLSALAAEAGRLDVVFPVLHGTYGEDGTVQGLLELANVPYVGAGVLGSAVGLDKVLFKDVMRAHGLPVVDDVAVKRRHWEARPDDVLREIERTLRYPVFAKPANLGSSVGVSKCADRASLVAGLTEAARFDRKLVVEAAVPGAREIEVSVLGNDDPVTSVPGEVVPSREFYSYEAKYLDIGENASQLHIPAPISEEEATLVRDLAVKAYVAIDCAGMARADFLLSSETGDLYINELNTIPGFTAISMYPKLWQASGVSYSDLIDRLISLALERHDDRARSETDYHVVE